MIVLLYLQTNCVSLYQSIDLRKYHPRNNFLYFIVSWHYSINSEQQQFETYDESRDDVKIKISLEACIALQKSGAIDDNLVPTNKKIKNNIIAQEKDDHGKQVGSRG